MDFHSFFLYMKLQKSAPISGAYPSIQALAFFLPQRIEDLLSEMHCDLFHPFSLLYLERTSGITVTALDTGGSLYLQLFIMICRQSVSGFCQIVIFVDQAYIQPFWTGLTVIAVHTDSFCGLGRKTSDHRIVSFLRRCLEKSQDSF